MAMQKTTCPISEERFIKSARPMLAKLGETPMTLSPRSFQTGSFGFFANGKVTLAVDGVPVVFQCGMTLTAVGSKSAPRNETAAPEVASK